jgi:hypothetical protein
MTDDKKNANKFMKERKRSYRKTKGLEKPLGMKRSRIIHR